MTVCAFPLNEGPNCVVQDSFILGAQKVGLYPSAWGPAALGGQVDLDVKPAEAASTEILHMYIELFCMRAHGVAAIETKLLMQRPQLRMMSMPVQRQLHA